MGLDITTGACVQESILNSNNMQAIIFKIFLLLFLTGGKESLTDKSSGFPIDNVVLAKNMSLQMNGDPLTLE